MELKVNQLVLESLSEIETAAPAQLYDYWQQKRDGRARPAWHDIELMDMWKIADVLAVKDALHQDRDFRYRYWGSKHSDLAGFDGSGKTGTQILERAAFGHVFDSFWATIDGAAPIRASGTLVTGESEKLAYEGIHLPLGDADGAVGHLISAYSYRPLA